MTVFNKRSSILHFYEFTISIEKIRKFTVVNNIMLVLYKPLSQNHSQYRKECMFLKGFWSDKLT